MVQVKRELLQLEQEEMKRQRENMAFRENHMCGMETRNSFRNKRLSLEDISNPVEPQMYMYHPDTDYRKSMPELQHNAINYVYNAPIIDPINHIHTSPIKPVRPRLPDHYDGDDFLK